MNERLTARLKIADNNKAGKKKILRKKYICDECALDGAARHGLNLRH